MTHAVSARMNRRTFLHRTAVVAAAAAVGAIMLGGVEAASVDAVLATITAAGTVGISDGTVILPFPRPGKWAELEGKASDRYDTRHFLYVVPNASPAIELYVVRDRQNEPPDGAFEIGLVRGFLTAFAAKAGFRLDESLVFQKTAVDPAPVIRTTAKLSADRRTLWAYAYIYPRTPSLIFLAIRAEDGSQAEIEMFLAGNSLK